jgi:hypothetical protein
MKKLSCRTLTGIQAAASFVDSQTDSSIARTGFSALKSANELVDESNPWPICTLLRMDTPRPMIGARPW